jgi:transposase-like protein
MQADMEGGRVGAGRKPFTEEFKRSVVEHWLESGNPARKVAEESGIKQWNLRDWRFKFAPALKDARRSDGGLCRGLAKRTPAFTEGTGAGGLPAGDE